MRSEVYDPFNRTVEHNERVLDWANEHADVVVLSNVLNVIEIESSRRYILKMVSLYAPMVYISVYEGDRSGKGGKTRDGWQENRKLASYLEEIYNSFDTVTKHGNLLMATNGV